MPLSLKIDGMGHRMSIFSPHWKIKALNNLETEKNNTPIPRNLNPISVISTTNPAFAMKATSLPQVPTHNRVLEATCKDVLFVFFSVVLNFSRTQF